MTLRQGVLDNFVDLTRPLEGYVPTPYVCLKHVFTIALGNASFSVAAAQTLPLRYESGALASKADIATVYNALQSGSCQSKGTKADPAAYRRCLWPGKARNGVPCFQHRGWKAAAAHVRPRLHIARPDADALVHRVMFRMWGALEKRWAAAEPATWSADAQTAVLSWCWGVGPAAKFARLDKALLARDFAEAAKHITMRGAGTIPARNRKNQALLRNAAVVERDGLDRDVLHYPTDLTVERPRVAEPPPPTRIVVEEAPDVCDPYVDECERRDWLAVDSLDSLPARRAMLADSMAEMLRQRTRDRHGDE